MPALTVDQALQAAIGLHQSGRGNEAEIIYRQILAVDPGHAGALHLLGLIAAGAGRHAEAREFIARALERNPTCPPFHSNLGEIQRRLGKFDEAIASFRRALELDGNSPETHVNLAAALISVGQFDAAIASSRCALALRPDFAPGHNNLGAALAKKGQAQEAIACFRQALLCDPRYAEAQRNLGRVLTENQQYQEAIACLEPLARADPGDAEAHHDLATAYLEAREWQRAMPVLQRVLALRPDWAEAHNNLGNAFLHEDRLDEAIASYQRAVALRADGYPIAQTNLGVALIAQGRFAEALACYRQAVGGRPDFAGAHWNLAVLLLLLGQYEEGWREFEWRLQLSARDFKRRDVSRPWNGAVAPGETILIRSEQGFGDTLHFLRYLPLVQKRSGGARLILECTPVLARLLRFEGNAPAEITTTLDQTATHRQIALLSLPWTLREFEPLPMERPYLSADPALRSLWRERLGEPSAFRVGLAWAGSATHTGDRHRSIPREKLLPLLRVPGAEFHSLQVADGTRTTAAPFPGLIDLTTHIADFADTAALMMELDLIITVDTATAHLAGALGRPVWTLLPFVPDWRWGLEREDTPWYPTMRLFRQKTAGNWDEVIQRVVDELRASTMRTVP